LGVAANFPHQAGKCVDTKNSENTGEIRKGE